MMKEMNVQTVAALRKLSVTAVSDALDKLGLPGGLLGIGRMSTEKCICGPAFTVRYVPCGMTKGTVGDFLDAVQPGQVVVIDNHGRTDCTVWGNLMSKHAGNRRVEGTVIDGACRDIDVIRQLDYPVYAKGVYMMTGKDRVMCAAVNEPVSICGRQVRPDDIIMGDGCGAIVIPAERAAEVAKTAQMIEESENRIVEAINQGFTLAEARRINGYHSLQTKNK